MKGIEIVAERLSYFYRVVETVDTLDFDSSVLRDIVGSTPTSVAMDS